jgi:hypothetical protein
MKNPLSIGKKLLVLLLILSLFPSKASAQVLDQQINALLANNCAGLGTGGFPTPNLTGLGPNLTALCDVPQTVGAVSTGGGAASVQGSAASILNRAVFGRFVDLKQEEKDGTVCPYRHC